jgi:tetratricopeptide (TPR) repeat protein
MTLYILGDYQASFTNINKSLELMPNDKNALLLKGEVMLKLGMQKEAEAIIDRAEFLPEGGWQERFSLQ